MKSKSRARASGFQGACGGCDGCGGRIERHAGVVRASRLHAEERRRMADHEGFLQDILATPEDDAPRLIYADWLEENGGAEGRDRAAFIRLQCERARLPEGDPKANRLKVR